MRVAMGTVVGVLALLGIAASIGHYFVEPYNTGFLEHPAITNAHVVLGAVYLALAPVQLAAGVRRRAIGYHRWAGRLLVAVGAVVGASALFLGVVVAFAGNAQRLVIEVMGGFFFGSILMGFRAIRAGEVAQHRAWMIRALATRLSIATMRLMFIPALIVVGNPTEEQIAILSVGSTAIAFLLHLAVAEWWLRRDAPRGVPAQAAVSPA